MDNIIVDNKSAFLKGRNILDDILILNEAYDEANRRKIKRFFFKVDFAKAYDSVSWSFLEQMMIGLNFNEKWRKWIRECVELASANVLVNGSPSGEFKLKRVFDKGTRCLHSYTSLLRRVLASSFVKPLMKGILQATRICKNKIHISHM
ncbi:hypothetical protein ACS0TY_014144 [Phlomoides rotata]